MVLAIACRAVQNLLGYVWPAYLCYKAVEARDGERIRDWCVYWFVLALFATAERLLDLLLFWLPLYHPAKVAFVVYLWHPSSRGASQLYERTIRPALGPHEAAIDGSVEEARQWAGQHLTVYRNRAAELVARIVAEVSQAVGKVSAQVGSDGPATGNEGRHKED